MDDAKRKALEDAGFKIGTVEEFLGIDKDAVIEYLRSTLLKICSLKTDQFTTHMDIVVNIREMAKKALIRTEK
jgi:hypothetical protein